MNNTLDRKKAPAVYPIGRLEMPSARTVELSNGVKLHVIDRGEEEVNRLSVYFPGGDVEAPLTGLAQLAASTVIEGTGEMTSEQIADAFDFNGSWAQASASVHHHQLTVYSLNSCMDEVMPVIAGLVMDPRFPDHDVEVAREKLALKAHMSAQRVAWTARKRMQELVFGKGSRMGRMAAAEDFQLLTPAMLRDWHESTFCTNGMNVIISGRISAELEDKVARCFEEMRGTASTPERIDVALPEDSEGMRELIRRQESLQTAVCCAIPTIGRRHPDYEALRLAVTFLGGYFGSRLMLNIREDKGYTYGIGAALEGYADYGLITVSTECGNDYTPAVLSEIAAELQRMKDPATYSADELKRARSFVETGLAAQLDSPFAVADYYATQLINDSPAGYFSRQQQALRNMTPDTLAEIASRYFREDKMYTVLAGNPPE